MNFLNNIKYNINAAILTALIPTISKADDADEVFADIEDKGNIVIDFLTNGAFAFIVVVLALLWVTIGFLQSKMEWQRCLTIVLAAVALGNIPTIARWLLS
jgi:type IV secretory pathway VirB2 component (pilin)